MTPRTRFAPSPTGLLHVGNAYSALQCRQWAERHHAELLLRIEDIDATRCRPEYTDAILEDLAWLGLSWKEPVRRQSEHARDYAEALARLRDMGVIYPCFCTRSDIRREIERMGSAPHAGEHAEHYPGTCRSLAIEQQQQRMWRDSYAWRLDAERALAIAGDMLSWQDGHGRQHPVHVGSDVIIGRKDIGFSYHLAVVVDDALQGVTHVIRGEDLAGSTGIHRLLQALLNLPAPVYIHHGLLRDARGQRLAKRDRATTLRGLRQAGVTPAALCDYLLRPDPRWPFTDHEQAATSLALGSTARLTHTTGR
ncbi:MAG TPA: tRNA glutamyl-Q(34) synthetase GluQRS [Mariprofundaceae bacterium]|nr:tRNA glutamyl-Q(34) synthetase GluQRS [Mariprofundaceae bacterium]